MPSNKEYLVRKMKDQSKGHKYWVGWKVPLYLVVIFSGVSLLCVNLVFKYFHADEPMKETQQATKCATPLNIIRENDYKLTRPLLLAEVKGDDKKYDGIKKQIGDYIESFIKTSVIKDASVYYCSLIDNTQFIVNPDVKYHPTNMLEIAKMISLIKQSERNQDLLEKKVLYKKKKGISKQSHDAVGNLDDNGFYSIRKLMFSMITSEDENATLALNPYIDTVILKNLYASIQIAYPGISDDNFLSNIYNAAKFLRILYSAGYLTESHSEQALNLISNSSYKDGMLKPFDKDTKFIHLYAEHDYAPNKELHEFAIVYFKNKPYLLAIMTKGGERKNLSIMFSNISKMIYDHLNSPS